MTTYDPASDLASEPAAKWLLDEIGNDLATHNDADDPGTPEVPFGPYAHVEHVDGHLVVGPDRDYEHWLDPEDGEPYASVELNDAGYPDGPVVRVTVEPEAAAAARDTQLAELMHRCAQAMEDDAPCLFYGVRPGSTWNGDSNSYEAGSGLQQVAEILGIPGPHDIECEPSS